jgi:hypothetical protein
MYLLRTGKWNLPRPVLEKCLSQELIGFVWEAVSINVSLVLHELFQNN